MNIDITKMPFSRYGAFLSVTKDNASLELCIRNVKRMWEEVEAFRLAFEKDGRVIDAKVEAVPSAIKLSSPEGSALIYIKGDEELVIESTGFDIALKAVDKQGVFPFKVTDSIYKYIFTASDSFCDIGIIKGDVQESFEHQVVDGRQRTVRADIRIMPGDRECCVHIRISDIEKPYELPVIDTKKDISEIDREWEAFLAKIPSTDARWANTARLAWYNMWSCFVRGGGNFTSDALLMSKGYMSAVWSWDHCFNAMALSKKDLPLALEQFFLMFEHQDRYGKIPDLITANRKIWAFHKPPIHGWAFLKMTRGRHVDPAVLKKAYDHLSRWTQWFFSFRDTDNDGIPGYIAGCDSGWDNSTLFDSGCNIESPDLCAFLFLQMKALEEIAERLGDTVNAKAWGERAAGFFERFMEHSWTDRGFVARHSGTHEYEECPGSMLVMMPLSLGEYLPEHVLEVLTGRLVKDFATQYGVATESPKSGKYMRDGYWRGPIWAPTTYLLADGLKRAGKEELAVRIAESFCNLVEQSGGFFENYDALTGEGLCDRGYTWTASVALLLMNEFLYGGGGNNA